MKVLLLNGSPRKNGCTYTALNVVADALKAEGIDAEVFQAGDPDMENVKAAAAKLKDSDALVVGSPVYWASPSGQIIHPVAYIDIAILPDEGTLTGTQAILKLSVILGTLCRAECSGNVLKE